MSEQDEQGQAPTEAPEAQDAPAQDVEPVEAQAVESEKKFDEAYVKKLRAEAAKHRTEAAAAKAKAEEYEDAQKSEIERAQSKLAKVEKAKAEAESKLLRYEVATERAVPSELVALLTAETREGLDEQADLILKNAVQADPPPTSFDGGSRESAPDTRSPGQAHNAAIVDLLKNAKV